MEVGVHVSIDLLLHKPFTSVLHPVGSEARVEASRNVMLETVSANLNILLVQSLLFD
jgi:hypothetical protein